MIYPNMPPNYSGSAPSTKNPQPKTNNMNPPPTARRSLAARRRNGKIARLPEAIRQQLNQKLQDGLPYDEIIAWLSDQGHPGILRMNLSRWAHGGLQDWLEDQQLLKERRDQYDWALDMAERKDDRTMLNAARQLNALHFFDAINRMDSVELSKMLDRRPEKFLTLLNSFSKHRKGGG